MKSIFSKVTEVFSRKASESEKGHNETGLQAGGNEESPELKAIYSSYDRVRASEFYSQFICKGDLVFDVGANIGNRADVFLELGAKVVAFEPQEACVIALKEKFKGSSDFFIEQCALGSKQGEETIFMSESHAVSTLSERWIEESAKSNRFEGVEWVAGRKVSVETLDIMIEKYGVPAFIKIDVEDFELEVLRGLSSPISALSFEFARESFDNTVECMSRVNSLQNSEFQISLGESMEFYMDSWLSLDKALEVLDMVGKNYRLAWGDVYARKSESVD